MELTLKAGTEVPSAPSRAAARPPKQYRWEYREAQPDSAQLLRESLGISAVVARVLANRGLISNSGELEQFVRPSLTTLHDPFALAGMRAAVDRLLQAKHRGEKVLVYGDYDTDGTTSTAVLLRTFHKLGIDAAYYIPHRLAEGYGLNATAIESIARRGVRLIVTVDTGIGALEQVVLAKSLGMDVIVTDHHQPGPALPEAVAIVNPNRADCTYPNKCLAGVGVAFKLSHALLKGFQISSQDALPFLRSLLDLVAIGTVADFAPLIGENRVLVAHGLEQIRRTSNAGVAELVRLLDPGVSKITTHHVGFQLAPRLNAAGRTDHAGVCVELLTTEDRTRAAEIAMQLDGFNQDRRNVESGIFEQCIRFVDENLDVQRDRVFVINGAGWHLGVVGIVASRIMDMYDRPVIVLSEQHGAAKGSARSTKGFNIHAALTACGQYLTAFGGHPNAAGLQLDCAHIASFREAINTYAVEAPGGAVMCPVLTIDTDVHGWELDEVLIRDLGLLEPHGHSNPAPVLSTCGLRMSQTPKLVGNNHLKLQFRQGERLVSAIGFNMGSRMSELQANRNATFDAAFVPTLNTYYAQPRIEMELKDLRLSPAI
ncbi:MAG: single-stranded-DNA-specific exonuclease RecJ [Candidatus Sumerlaeaceae bacterium]